MTFAVLFNIAFSNMAQRIESSASPSPAMLALRDRPKVQAAMMHMSAQSSEMARQTQWLGYGVTALFMSILVYELVVYARFRTSSRA